MMAHRFVIPRKRFNWLLKISYSCVIDCLPFQSCWFTFSYWCMAALWECTWSRISKQYWKY